MADKNELLNDIIGDAPKTTYHVFVTLNGYEDSYTSNFDVVCPPNKLSAMCQIADRSFYRVKEAFRHFDSDDVFIDVFVLGDDQLYSKVISSTLGSIVNDLWSLGFGSLDHDLDYLSLGMRSVLRDESEIV